MKSFSTTRSTGFVGNAPDNAHTCLWALLLVIYEITTSPSLLGYEVRLPSGRGGAAPLRLGYIRGGGPCVTSASSGGTTLASNCACAGAEEPPPRSLELTMSDTESSEATDEAEEHVGDAHDDAEQVGEACDGVSCGAP